MWDIAKYDPAEARDEHGRWSAAAGRVVLRGTKIAAHAVHLHAAVTQAVNAPSFPQAITHAYSALSRGEALVKEIQALPDDARELGAETLHKLRQARAALLRLKARLTAAQASHARAPA